jgi:putative SOS response-associated peptidase YedK
MCGRAYITYSDDELYFQYLNRRPIRTLNLAPIYNLCPTQNVPVLRLVNGERQFDEMHWQLIPEWEPLFKTKLSTINARSETVFGSPLFGPLIFRKRCVVPLSGFYEWKRENSTKRPFKIYRADGEIMSVAGLWDTWHAGEPDARHSFTIVTTAANGAIGGIHDRMPLILDRSGVDAWIDPTVHERQVLWQLMKPCPESWLEAREVSNLVNSAKNNSPELLEPLL